MNAHVSWHSVRCSLVRILRRRMLGSIHLHAFDWDWAAAEAECSGLSRSTPTYPDVLNAAGRLSSHSAVGMTQNGNCARRWFGIH